MELGKYILRRLMQMIPVILAVTVLNFLIITLAPGDPVTVLAGEQASPEYIAQLRISYGLDKPILVRLGIYIGNLLKGDLGYSFMYQRPVMEVLLQKMQATLILVTTSLLIAVLVGIFLGTFAARKEGTWIDNLITNGTLLIYCMPVFWIGMILILIFSVNLKLLPTSGMYSFGDYNYPKALDLMRHLILPSFALFLVELPTYTKLTRSSVIEVAQEDFVLTARAIGYSEKDVYIKHALRNALIPTVTVAGMSLSTVFAGALLTETVFSWPGMGRLIFEGVSTRDYPILMGSFLMTTIMVVVGSFIIDLIYMCLDPRVTQS